MKAQGYWGENVSLVVKAHISTHLPLTLVQTRFHSVCLGMRNLPGNRKSRKEKKKRFNTISFQQKTKTGAAVIDRIRFGKCNRKFVAWKIKKKLKPLYSALPFSPQPIPIVKCRKQTTLFFSLFFSHVPPEMYPILMVVINISPDT